MHILVTGGTGYIGSHTVIELLERGHKVTIVDNLSNSSAAVIDRIEQISGQRPACYQADIRDRSKLREIFDSQQPDGVIHFAALKAVAESVAEPLRYFDNNVGGMIALLQAVQASSVRTFVFSSSATVYGDQPIPYTETTPLAPTNPYGHTKVAAEMAMRDQAAADPSAAMVALRYFNPIGAHPSGLIGEDPSGVPNNLMPYIAQVAAGKRDKLQVFGGDYPTPDGTAIRDYIHVVDLAKGHIAALEHALASGFRAYNLGSGHGESVLAVIKAFEASTGRHIPYEIVPRRAGDLAEFYADPALAADELEWKTRLTLADACRDTWNWQSRNPDGYPA